MSDRADWNSVALKRLLAFGNGRDHKPIEVDEPGFPVYGSGGRFAFASDFLHDGESVLFGRKGTVDRPLYVNERFWTVDTMYYTKIEPTCHARFLYYAALTIPFDMYSTNTALPSITQETLGKHKLLSPPLAEQQQIAAFLDYETSKIDALIEKQQQLIALLGEKRQAVISHAVTKGLNPNAPMRASGVEWLGEVPEHWTVSNLGYALNAVGDVDHHMPPSVEKGVPYVMTGDLEELVSQIDFAKCKQVAHHDYERLCEKIKTTKGDLIMAKYATVGAVSYVDIDSEFLVSYSCATLKPNTVKALGRYLFFCLKSDSFAHGIRQKINTNTQENVGNATLKKVKVAIPPIEEQLQIAKFLRARVVEMGKVIESSEAAVDLLQERRTALISAAVTGKIDVRGWKRPAPEAAHEPEREVA